MTKVVEILLLPPFNLIIVAVTGLILARYRLRFGWGLVVAALTLLYALSTPLVGGLLSRSLYAFPALTEPALSEDVGAIVVLGAGKYAAAREYGGESLAGQGLERVRYGAWLHRRTGVPMLVTGGNPGGVGLAEAVIMRQVIEDDFNLSVAWVESGSNNTWENARKSWDILSAADVRKIYLVTHGYHMPRAVSAFERAGFEVVPAPTILPGPMRIRFLSFIPRAGALSASASALREWLGRAGYALRG